MIIDMHAHLYAGADYVPRLLRTMDRLGIDKACLSAFAPHFGWPTPDDPKGNDAVEAAVRAHPDRLIGFVFVRPGKDGPETIREGRERGFRGVKVTCPRAPYDDPAYDGLWGAAEEAGLPVLFHTGVVTLPHARPDEGIRATCMQPILLESISRAFPDLTLVCAHLGIHWNEDAAEVIRMRPNVYADITGEPGGWRERALPRLGDYLWWPGAADKLVFGTDVTPETIEGNLRRDRETLEAMGVSEATRERYFHGNAERILGL